MKIGDIIYVKDDQYWCDTSYSTGSFHHIDKHDKFKIINFTKYGYCLRTIVKNINGNFNIMLPHYDLEELFLTKSELRKLKLKKLKK